MSNREIELSNQALKYFKKRLLLSENLNDFDNKIDEETDVSESKPIEQKKDSPETKPSAKTTTNIEDIESAKEILSNFPIDRSSFSPERQYIVNSSVFSKPINIDKVLNSLLFATKLAFFDVSESENSVIKEVSEDSFGYMNILRHNQIEILDTEVNKLKNKLEYLGNDDFISNINNLRSYKEQDTEDLTLYLDELISFYALNVMNNNNEENIKLIKEWLNNKIGDIYE